MDVDRKERVRVRAYFLWQAAGCPDGRDEVFWADALTTAEKADTTPSEPSTAQDQAVDEAVDESFPASDPPGHTAITGERT